MGKKVKVILMVRVKCDMEEKDVPSPISRLAVTVWFFLTGGILSNRALLDSSAKGYVMVAVPTGWGGILEDFLPEHCVTVLFSSLRKRWGHFEREAYF